MLDFGEMQMRKAVSFQWDKEVSSFDSQKWREMLKSV